DRPPVEREHAGEEPLRDLVAGVADDLDPVLGERPPLAPNLVPTLAPEAAEILVEGREAGVLPVILPAETAEPAARGKGVGVVGLTEGHVHRRETRLGAGPLEPSRENRDDVAPRRVGRNQEAGTGDRRERHADEELRVVGDARAGRRGRPALVEDEL